MLTAQECRVRASAMQIRSLTASNAAEREQYAELAEGWRFVSKIAARQDEFVADWWPFTS
jgi:hypothetical protein